MIDAVIQRTGGKVAGDHLTIKVQRPKAPKTLEQWTNKREVLTANDKK